jgi:hypothetical protein
LNKKLNFVCSMTPLKVDEQGLPNGWADVGPGDAVVAFSRKDIYRARKVRAVLFVVKYVELSCLCVNGVSKVERPGLM